MTRKFQTGDVVYAPGFPGGHIQLIYQGSDDLHEGPLSPGNHMIHAQYKGDFHIDPKLGFPEGQRAFRHRSMTHPMQIIVRRVADMIANSAEYRLRGIGKLIFSSSKVGEKSTKRLEKYEVRIEKLLKEHHVDIVNASDHDWYQFLEAIDGSKVVSCVTCAEAVVLCYQLASQLARTRTAFIPDCNIALSARATLPSTLVKALTTDARWEEITNQIRPPKPKASPVKGSGNSGFGGLPIKTVGHRT